MLADTIRATARTPFNEYLCGGVAEISAAIERAGRFELSPGLIVSAAAVMRSPIESQAKALSLCKLPFDYTWLEWSGSDPLYDRVNNGNPPPARVGCLVMTDDSRQRGSMSFAWTHGAGASEWNPAGLTICPLSVNFDWNSTPLAVGDVASELYRNIGMSVEDLRGQQIQNLRRSDNPAFHKASDEGILSHVTRMGIAWCGFLKKWSREIIATQGALPGPGTPEWNQWVGDLKGEPDCVRAVIMLLNSRNMVTTNAVSNLTALNKKRTRQGKLPLLDHTTVRINLSRTMNLRVGSAAHRDPFRLHVVRGHFKVRKSGVYWWSDHLRGDLAKGAVAHSYQVSRD